MYPGAFVESHGSKPAVIMADTGWTQTFSELDQRANQLSRVFRSAGLQPGDHVALCMENHPRFLEILWGCEYAGLIYTAISSRLTAEESAYIINDCGARAYITSSYKAGLAEALLAMTPRVELRLMLDGTISGFDAYDSTVDAQSAEPLEGRLAGADMLYSSGTTGRPKGVLPVLTAQPLEERAMSVRGLIMLLFGMDDTKIYLSPAPLYHAAPLRFCLSSLALGATVVVMDRFEPELYLSFVEKYRITHSQMVPTMFIRLLKLDDAQRLAHDLSSLEMVVHAAAPCPVEVKRQMIEWWGPVIHEYYAGTEGNGFVYCNSEMWLDHPGTVGVPINCQVHIVGDDGEEVPQGETGTVYFSGGSEFVYHNDEAKDGRLPAPARLVDAWRCGLPRCRWLLVPHRSQGIHDHHRRCECVPAGGGKHPGDAPQGRRRCGVRRTERRVRRRGEGRRSAGGNARRRRGSSGAVGRTDRLLPSSTCRREVPTFHRLP